MNLTAFEERQFLKWGNFIKEVADKVNQNAGMSKKFAFSKEEKQYIDLQISRGNDLQKQLNEKWEDKGYMTYGMYMKNINRYIGIQDSIISDISEYIDKINEFKLSQ